MPSTLNPTIHSWISHDVKPQPFLGKFVTNIRHVSQPRLYLTCFFVFKDTTSPQILISYTTSEHSGSLEFKVPILPTQVNIDTVSLPSPGDLRKTTKKVTFKDLLTSTLCPQPHHTLSPSPCGSGLRKTMKKVTFKEHTIDATPHIPIFSLNNKAKVSPKALKASPSAQVCT